MLGKPEFQKAISYLVESTYASKSNR